LAGREGAVAEVSFGTSKSGVLWPTGYWKDLVDSLAQRGARNDPRVKYPDLADALESLIEARNGRYYPRPGTALSGLDDAGVRMIRVRRAPRGSESVQVSHANRPDTTGWEMNEFPYFGTIGNSKYEAQSKANQLDLAKSISQEKRLEVLSLSFTLSLGRRDRDLDNLFDGLAPFFNRSFPALDEILLLKEDGWAGSSELLRHHLGARRRQLVAKVVAADL
jgi:hypothetical protein